MTQNSIKFQTSNNTLNGWVMKITADRRIEVAEGVDVTETAKKVLEAMQQMIDGQKRTWVGLTDEEIWDAYMKAPLALDCSTDELYAISRTVEAKLKEKNHDY